MIPIVVYTADAQAKREATAVALAGPSLPRVAPSEVPTKESLRGPLKAMRQEARARQPELLAALKEAMVARQIPCHEAVDAAAALQRIAAIAGEVRHVAINKSGVVYNELRPALQEAGFQVIDTYFDQFAEAARVPLRHWELPPLEHSRVGISFSGHPVELPQSIPVRRMVGLLGVTAMAAADGTVFFLEHFSNISRVLQECQTLILVVALDKLVPDRTAAELQVQGMALFGLDSLLLDLRPRADKSPLRMADVPLAPAAPARALHVIVLDNGRAALASGGHAALLDCIGCRACLRQCPTYAYFGGPNRRNPKEYLAHALAEPAAPLNLCTSCGMCLTECPVDIDIPFMIAEHRAQARLTLQRWALARAEISSKLASWTAPLSNWALRQRALRVLLEKTAGIHRDRTLPAFTRDSLPRWFRRPAAAGGDRRPEVAYFAGCSANYATPKVGRALVAILERNGWRVTYPPQRCSGMPAFANGDLGLARRNAEYNLRSLAAVVERGGDIVTTCTSCSLMLKTHYPQLLGERALSVAARVFNSEEYLLRLHRQGKLDTNFRPVPARVAYHVPCHLKDQRLERMSVDLLNLIPGLTATAMRGGCSGMCGTFGMKSQFYGISMEIGSHMFAEIERPEVEIPATDCPTCTLQMDHGTSKTTQHPLLLVAQAYGLDT